METYTDFKVQTPTIYHKIPQWSIAFYRPAEGGKTVRTRQTFDLNRLPDMVHRGQRAKYIAFLLEKWAITEGYPLRPTSVDDVLNDAPREWLLAEAVRYCCDIKHAQTTRDRTKETFSSYTKVFVSEFLKEMGWLNRKLSDFKRKDAQLFMDWLIQGGTKRAHAASMRGKSLAGETLNNYRTGYLSLFKELEKRELIDKNVWLQISTYEVQEAARRPMTEGERDVIMKALYDENPFFLLGVLFQYYCAIRPAEIRRLKFRMIDLDAGLIIMSPDDTKNKKRGVITIPKPFLEILKAFSIGTFPADWWIFGHYLKPHPTVQMGEKTLSNMHRTLLARLVDEGKLSNIEGLQFYSWKDTGGVDMVTDGIDIDDIRRHFRHSSLDYTQRYLRKKQTVIESIKQRDNGVTDSNTVKEKLLGWTGRKKK